MTLSDKFELGGEMRHNGSTAMPPAPVPGAPAETPGKKDEGKLIHVASERHRDLAELLAKPAEALGDAEFVHDVRVAARRLGEVARLIAMRGLLEKPAAKAVEGALKSLRRSMGELRDADVTEKHLEKWRMPAAVKHIAGELAGKLRAGRLKLAEAAGGQMRSASVTGAMVILARVLEEHSKPEQAQEAERELRAGTESQMKKREKQMRRAFGKAARKQTAAVLHEARIAVKKLRYVMELAQETGHPQAGKQRVKFLKQLQELLGDHHDAHVIEEKIQAHLKDRHDGAGAVKGLPAAWRKWHGEMEHAQARRAAEFFARSYAWMNG